MGADFRAPNLGALWQGLMRDGGSGDRIVPPTGLTARFFVAKERLNVIVGQPRIEYFGQWRINPSIKPTLTFGSRTAANKMS